MSLNPVSKVLLDGLYDEGSPLSQLRGCQHLVKKIWMDVTSYWERMIELPASSSGKSGQLGPYNMRFDKASSSLQQFFAPISDTNIEPFTFPEASGVNINMMPFIVGETWKQCKLPDFVKPYWDMIQQCIGHHSDREHHHMWNSKSVTIRDMMIEGN